ncbi:MAG TPA: hypothetical protein DCS30_03640 [Rhizobiales bacterium]|nr:hypothetical protein [Hyphomicrobiales bacterium]
MAKQAVYPLCRSVLFDHALFASSIGSKTTFGSKRRDLFFGSNKNKAMAFPKLCMIYLLYGDITIFPVAPKPLVWMKDF